MTASYLNKGLTALFYKDTFTLTTHIYGPGPLQRLPDSIHLPAHRLRGNLPIPPILARRLGRQQIAIHEIHQLQHQYLIALRVVLRVDGGVDVVHGLAALVLDGDGELHDGQGRDVA